MALDPNEIHLRYGSVINLMYTGIEITAMVIGFNANREFITDEGTADDVLLLVLGHSSPSSVMGPYYPLLGTASCGIESITRVLSR